MNYQSISPSGQPLEPAEVELEMVFPKVDPEFVPYGTRVVVQLRSTVNRTRSGIILAEETRRTEAWNTQVGRIIAVGQTAFCNRQTGEPWPEGAWAAVGDFVRVPKHGGDRLSVTVPGFHEPVVLVLLNDYDLLGRYTGDPRKVKSFID